MADQTFEGLGNNRNAPSNRTVINQNLNYQNTWTSGGATVTNAVGLPLILKENPSGSDLTKTPDLKVGVPSFINPYAVLTFPDKFGNSSSPFNSLIDDPSSDIKFSGAWKDDGIRNIDPTVYNLVNEPPDLSGKDFTLFNSKTPYRYTDFLYCKYYGKIPNNYLITLRRYPAPAFDNLAIPLSQNESGEMTQKSNGQSDFKPIAQAVTWMGEEPGNKISDLLGFEVNMNWKKVESAVESVHGNEQDASDGPEALAGAAKFLSILSGAAAAVSGQGNNPQIGSAWDAQNARYDPYANGPYSNRVYGPVNVIASTYKRDRGLDFKQTFSLNFEYSLKSIAGINPKAAMLDIMANMLMLTYNNAAFWGGANRYFANRPVVPFFGGPGGMNAWYKGDPVQFSREVGKAIAGAEKDISSLFTDLMANPIDALTKLASGGLSMGLKLLEKGRAPDIVAFKALLTGEPIGEWHMVVGNPYNPILRVGNLICTGAKFQFNEVLGADNFPTELKVTISLEHGRPRDKGDIESMFNDGNGRIYYAPASRKDVFSSSAQQISHNDNSFRKNTGNGQLETPRDREPGGVSFIGPTLPTSARTGNDSQLNQIIDNLSYAFRGDGHELAVKMGLASTGSYTRRDKEVSGQNIPAATKGNQ